MADFDPDAYLAAKPATPAAFDPDAYLAGPRKGYLANVGEAGSAALDTINRTLNPFSQSFQAERARQVREGQSVGEALGSPTWRGIGAIGELASSPITGAYKTAAPYVADLEAKAIQAIGEPIARSLNPNVVLPSQQQISSDITPQVETALGLAAPRAGMPTAGTVLHPSVPPPAPVVVPPQPTPSGPFGVTLSEGQATGDLSTIQREQAALRGTSGVPAERAAKEFADQQEAQLAAAQGDIAKSLDVLGNQIIATGPQEAGELVSSGVQQAAKSAKAGVKSAYEAARAMPGEIHAGVFENMRTGIKGDLSLRPEPVIVDDRLTPYASRMIDDINDRVSQLRIQNKADPFGQPNPENILGVNLAGVDQMRKRLSAMRRDAYASGNAADGRAAKAVLDAFDDRIDAAVNGGQFTGDARAVQAWNDARAAYADYRSTFTGNKNDPIGRVVEKIIGDRTTVQKTGNDVADHLFGASGVNPSSLNVGVATRIKSILGEQSPEWVAARQGLFSRLTETPPGVTDWGPGKIANRLNQFLNGDGKELANVVFSQQERAMLQRYADLMRQLEVPQAGANWSNTATFMQKIGNQVTSNMAAVLGGGLGHMLGLPYVGEIGGMAAGKGAASLIGRIGAAREAKAVSGLMPTVANQVKAWQQAVARAQRNPSAPARAAAGVAGSNLARSLQQMGITSVQAPLIGHAQENQDQIPRPPAQQHNGGGVKPEDRAHGGQVMREQPIQAQLRGARKAKDGRWYIPDTARSGRYLRVDAPQLERIPAQQQAGGGAHFSTTPVEGDPFQGQHRAAGGRVVAANIDTNPTEAQKKAGNYRKDHIVFHGLDVTIENAKGQMRRGVDKGGKPWAVRMPAHYGYFRGSDGADKDEVDVYVGPYKNALDVFVIDQVKADGGEFDEHKVMIQFSSRAEALQTYVAGFSDGKGVERLGKVTTLTVDGLKERLAKRGGFSKQTKRRGVTWQSRFRAAI